MTQEEREITKHIGLFLLTLKVIGSKTYLEFYWTAITRSDIITT